MNADFQGPSSFLSFGPVAVISRKSRLGAALQLDYQNPNFNHIKQRIEDRLPVTSTFRAIGASDFSDLSPIEIMALIWFYIDFLRACSLEDLIFCFDSAFNGHAGPKRIREILSVLVGTGLVVRQGPVGLVRIADPLVKLAEPSQTRRKQFQGLQLEMTNLLESDCDTNYLEAMAHAD
jgi:hypothetical protein